MIMPMTAVATRPTPAAPEGGIHTLTHVERTKLAEIIYTRSFGRGSLRLASGKVSSFYFDMKPAMLHPEGASLMAKYILAEATSAGAEYVGGLEMGAVPITGAVCHLSAEQGCPVHGFFVRKEAKT